MSDEKDADDASDWLASQFGATEAVPVPPAQVAPAVAPPTAWPAAPPPAAAPVAPPTVPFRAAPPPAPAPAAAPLAPAPTPNTGGGFNWGLKPGGAVDQPPTVPPPAAPLPASAPPPPAPGPASAPPPPAPVPAAVQATPVAPPLLQPPPLVEPPTPSAQSNVAAPTQPLSWDDFAATQQSAPVLPPVPEQPTEAYTVQPWQPAVPPTLPPVSEQHSTQADPTSAIDSLFSDHRFQDYEEVGVLKTIQAPPTAPTDEALELREPREPLPRMQKVLLGVAAGLLAALILVGLFFFGQHLGSAASITPTTAKTGASSATPTPAGTGGPAAPGVQQWTALQGGECIQPFSSAWTLTFTVVACTADHDAEMVFKGTLPDGADSKYPTANDFKNEITPLCSAPTAINYPAAASVTDLQITFSYPPNTTRWLAGDRTYYCFVDRVSGGNLPGDLAVAKPQ